MLTLGALAERFNLGYRGDPETTIDGIGTLHNAGPGQLAFLANSRYTAQLGETRAGVVILQEKDAGNRVGACLISADPYTSFALISGLFDDGDDLPEGINASASIDPSAVISPSARIGAFAVIGANAQLGDHVIIHPHCVIGKDCKVGDGSVLATQPLAEAFARLLALPEARFTATEVLEWLAVPAIAPPASIAALATMPIRPTAPPP